MLMFLVNRIEYDAFRSDFETQQLSAKDPVKLEEAQQKFELHREKFDRLRSDLSIKMKLLDENKVGAITNVTLHYVVIHVGFD